MPRQYFPASFLVIQMETKDRIQKYWDYRSRSYSADSTYNDTETRKAWLAWLSPALGQDKPLKILDVGTGPGFLALLFAEMGHEVTGVDLSGQMIEMAKANAASAGLVVTFQQGDAEKLPYPDGAFDIVASKYLLWTLPEPEKAMAEWRRVVKTGGTIMAIDGEWHKSDPVSRIRTGISGFLRPKPEYNTKFKAEYGEIQGQLPLYDQRPEKVTEIFTRCGLTNVSVKPMNPVYDVQNRKMTIAEKIAPASPVYFITGKK